MYSSDLIEVILRKLAVKPVGQIKLPSLPLSALVFSAGNFVEASSALRSAAGGNYTALQDILYPRKTKEPSLFDLVSNSAFFSISCLERNLSWGPTERARRDRKEKWLQRYSYIPWGRKASIEKLAGLLDTIFDLVCFNWPALPTHIKYEELVPPPQCIGGSEEVKAISLSGELDTTSPLEDGRELAAEFNNAKHYVIANMGHSVSTNSRCALSIVVDFFNTTEFPDEFRCANPDSQPIPDYMKCSSEVGVHQI